MRKVFAALTLMTGSITLLGLGLLIYEPATETKAGQPSPTSEATRAWVAFEIPAPPEPIEALDSPAIHLDTPVDLESYTVEVRIVRSFPVAIPQPPLRLTAPPEAIVTLAAPDDSIAQAAETRLLKTLPSMREEGG